MVKIFTVPFAETGDKVSPPNPTQADGTVSYAQGFGFDYQRKTDGTDPLAKVFPRAQFNGIVNDITAALGEIQQNGFTVWQDLSPRISYPIGAVVRSGTKNWVSLIANNTNAPQEGAFWTETTQPTYSRVQIDAKLDLKADKSTTLSGYGITDAYTITQTDSLLSQKATRSTTLAGYGITNAYTATEVDQRLALRALASNTYTKAEVDARTLESTETVRGTIALATQAQVDTGADVARAVTPRKMVFGFVRSFGATSGYIKFPAWLGGWLVQWGAFQEGQSVLTFPMAFPTAALNIQFTPDLDSSTAYGAAHMFGTLSTTGFTRGSGFTNRLRYLVWGY